MKLLFENKYCIKPLVSIIILDWSCRESFHVLNYLNNQKVPREQYEIIWIEYYSRRSPEIEAQLNDCERSHRLPVIDKWIVMEMPDNVYYHKHLMYNIGIVASKGKIVTICDSDAVVKPTFVEAIIKSFEEDSNIVLHMDEVRNADKKFYPFNYPSIEEIIGKGCINWKNGKTTGLLDKKDFIHSVNYGACMCALRDDLINIGGADEHMDYLGHICGPYDMTFRLVNAGKKEIWHQEEFLYHAWHPGTDGINNFLGPHDGRNMSTPALEARATGRIMPLVENPVIRMIRLKQDTKKTDGDLLSCMIKEEDIKRWTIDEAKILIASGKASYQIGNYDDAIDYWKKVLNKKPDDYNLLNDIGWAYYLKSNYKEALDAFNEALKYKPNKQRALSGRGWTYIQKGGFDEAILDFNRAIKYTDIANKVGLQEIFRGLGLAYFNKGQFLDAIENFDKAIENTDPNYKNVLQWILDFRGRAYYRIGRGDKAILDFIYTKRLTLLNSYMMGRISPKNLVSSVKQKLKSIS